jgi:hypothetical protein
MLRRVPGRFQSRRSRHAAPNDPRASAAEGRMAPVPADALIAAVCRRDFDVVARLLAPDVRMRAVLPSRYVDANGDQVVAWLARWFATADRFDVIAARSDGVAGRARVQWRFHVAPHPLTHRPGWHEIEQIAFFDTSAGLISRIDLISSGYRPLPQVWADCGCRAIADQPGQAPGPTAPGLTNPVTTPVAKDR